MAKIAVIGTGISGLAAAYLLHAQHDIAVYEKSDRAGGHSRTMTVRHGDRDIAVDTGFIVFNERNYPNLTALFRRLGVTVKDSDMSFGLTVDNGRLEWGAKSLSSLFGQRGNLMRPRFLKLVYDVLRFNAQVEAAVEKAPHLTLGALLTHMKLGDWFKRNYLLPMAGAIWSCPPCQMLDFPALTFVRFFANHSLLSVTGQPQWKTLEGGSQSYVERLCAPFADRIRLGCGAAQVTRDAGGVTVRDTKGGMDRFDQVVFACHADEALALLADPDGPEQKALSAIRYQRNLAILHSDTGVMPKNRPCWASWVYHADGEGDAPEISVTYWMNSLQGIDERYPLFVTLNPNREIADRSRLRPSCLRSSGVRFRRTGGTGGVEADAGRPAHLVLRRPSRSRFPRGWTGQRHAGGGSFGRARIMDRTGGGEAAKNPLSPGAAGLDPGSVMIRTLEASIFHERVRPKRNRFGYKVLYCLLPAALLAEKKRFGLFGLNCSGLFSVHAADYGHAPLADLQQLLKDWRLAEADGEIQLLTLPRVLGYGFNPVSFWLCRDREGGLRAVLADVSNTFGERHCYFCFHEDYRAILPGDTLNARKVFHVSPFIKVEGRYAFRFSADDSRVAVTIDLEDDEGLLLRTAIAGRPVALADRSLLALLARNPLYPFKVIGLIHYQAVRLFLKGVRHFHKPAPPDFGVSRGS